MKSIAQLVESIAQLIPISRVCRRPYLFTGGGVGDTSTKKKNGVFVANRNKTEQNGFAEFFPGNFL